MRKKLLVCGGAALALAIAARAASIVFAEKVGVAEIVVQKDVVLDEATLQAALANSADCAGFTITEVKPLGEGKLLASITGMHGACCIGPAKSALARVSGVEGVEVRLFRKSDL
jgi:hypothetical protein